MLCVVFFPGNVEHKRSFDVHKDRKNAERLAAFIYSLSPGYAILKLYCQLDVLVLAGLLENHHP